MLGTPWIKLRFLQRKSKMHRKLTSRWKQGGNKAINVYAMLRYVRCDRTGSGLVPTAAVAAGPQSGLQSAHLLHMELSLLVRSRDSPLQPLPCGGRAGSTDDLVLRRKSSTNSPTVEPSELRNATVEKLGNMYDSAMVSSSSMAGWASTVLL